MNEKQINLAVSLSLGQLAVVFWSQEAGLRQVLSRGEIVSWRKEEDLIPALEESFESAWARLPSVYQRESNENWPVNLALPPAWFEEDGQQLLPEKRQLTEQLVKHLEGENWQAVSQVQLVLNYLRQRDGESASYIAVCVNEDEIGVTPIVRGEVLPVEPVDRSESIALDLEEGLARFEIESPLPPRFILWGREDLEQIRADLLAFDWTGSEQGLFQHLPKVEVLPFEIIVESLVNQAELPEPSKEGAGSTLSDKRTEAAGQGLGFVKNQDIRQLQKKEEPTSPPPPKEKPASNPVREIGQKISSLAIGEKIKRRSRYFFLRLRRQKIGGTIALVLGGLAVLTAVLGGAWWFFSRARLNLAVKVQNLEESFDMTVSSQVNDLNLANRVIPAESLAKELEEKRQFSATGIDTVGEKAKGKVTIYNLTEIDKTFEKETVLQTDDLAFLTLEEVAVVAASTSFDEEMNKVTKPGKIQVEVEAEEIGPLYNLEEDQTFRVGSFAESDFLAKNSAAFSGGSSQEVTVVAEEDISQAKEDLSEALLARAQQGLKQEIDSTARLIEESLVISDKEFDFNKKVGEEAKEFSGTITAKAVGLAYRQSDFEQLADEYLADRVGENHRLDEDKNVNFSLVEEEAGEAVFNAELEAKIYPKLPQGKIKRRIAGRPPGAVDSYLSSLPGLVDYTIEIFPPLPQPLLRLPLKKTNITIEVTAE